MKARAGVGIPAFRQSGLVLCKNGMSTEEDQSWESLCSGVGAALIACQSAEKLVVFCLAHLFPDEPITSIEMLEQIDEQNRRKKMLGELIGELQKRVGPAITLKPCFQISSNTETRSFTIWNASTKGTICPHFKEERRSRILLLELPLRRLNST